MYSGIMSLLFVLISPLTAPARRYRQTRARAAFRKAHRAVWALAVRREWQSGGIGTTGHQAALVGVLSGWGRSIPSGQGRSSGQLSENQRFARLYVFVRQSPPFWRA